MAAHFPFLTRDAWFPEQVQATLTEALDGFRARRFGWETPSGRLLDPIADKLFVLAVLVTLIRVDWLSLADLLLIGLRDLTVASGALWVLLTGRERLFLHMRPGIPGKLATAAQFLFLASVLLLGRVSPWYLVPTAALSLFAAIDYVRLYVTVIRTKA
jgi:phosphatidylglycerophosphate synthase